VLDTASPSDLTSGLIGDRFDPTTQLLLSNYTAVSSGNGGAADEERLLPNVGSTVNFSMLLIQPPPFAQRSMPSALIIFLQDERNCLINGSWIALGPFPPVSEPPACELDRTITGFLT